MEKWIADEFKNVAKSDHRLKRRCIKVVSSMSANPAGSIYSSQQDASDLKATYRFFGNQRISDDEIFHSQIDRLTKDVQTLEPTVLLNIQDTTTLDFTNLKSSESLYSICRNQHHSTPMKGCFLHKSMLFSENGIPLGTSMYQFFGNSEGGKEKSDHKAIPLKKKKSSRWLLGAKSSREI